MRAAVYTRTSYERGDGEEDTRADQERRCRAFAESKGWQVSEVFTDRGISAWSGAERPGWAALERAVEARDVDAVLVFQVSRSARNVGRLHAFVTLCQDRGVTFASASEGLDTSTAMGRMMVTIIGALAELESEIKSERTRLTLDSMRDAGLWTGGRRPFGFRPEDGRLVVDPDEAGLVREAATALLNGEGLKSIARRWTARGMSTPSGNQWNQSNVRKMLRNPRHAGTALTRRDHGRILARLDERAAEWGRYQRGDRYMLTGLARCGLCGAGLVGRRDRKRRRYICTASGRVHLQIVADAVEDIVTRRAADAVREDETVTDPAALSADLRAALDAAEARLEDWAREAAAAGMSAAEIRAGREPLAAERNRVLEELEATAPAEPSWTSLLEDVPEPTPAEWRAYLETVINHVEIGPAVADGVRAPSTSARVRIRWRDGVLERS